MAIRGVVELAQPAKERLKASQLYRNAEGDLLESTFQLRNRKGSEFLLPSLRIRPILALGAQPSPWIISSISDYYHIWTYVL